MTNFLIKFVIAWLSSSVLVTVPIALSMGLKVMFAEKTQDKAIAAFISISIIAFIIGLMNILRYSLPFFLITWGPLWFFRKEIHVFDNYIIAGVAGLALGFIYWLILSHFDPHFRETLNSELSTKITYCLATIAGSTIMFLFGFFFKLKEVL